MYRVQRPIAARNKHINTQVSHLLSPAIRAPYCCASLLKRPNKHSPQHMILLLQQLLAATATAATAGAG